MERDTQKSKVYRAEQVLIPKAARLATIQEIATYVNAKLNRTTLRKRYGKAVDTKSWPITVGDGRGTRRALAHGHSHMTIPLWGRNEAIVLHEAAHLVHNRLLFNSGGDRAQELKGGASHGWQFAAIEIDLVHFIMGKEAADALKASFKLNRVRFRAKRKGTPRPAGINPFAPKEVNT